MVHGEFHYIIFFVGTNHFLETVLSRIMVVFLLDHAINGKYFLSAVTQHHKMVLFLEVGIST
jgi:hypothetical protein